MRALLAHAYRSSPYFRREFDACGIGPSTIHTLEDLREVPLLRRTTILQHFDELRAANADRFHPENGTTSGTSGAHLTFIRDRAALTIGNAALSRFRGWHGFRSGERVAEIRGVPITPGEPDRRPAVFHQATNILRLSPYRILDERWGAEVAEELVRFRPQAIRGMSTLLAHVSRFLLEHSEYEIRPRVVFTGGERVFPEQRTLIAEAFRAPVVEGYANWEYALFAGECEHGRLHFATEMGILEILDEGTPAVPGKPGVMAITNLWNRAFPFIRYVIGDVGYLDGYACPCGRGLPAGRILGGRQKDLLVTSRGHIWVPLGFTAHPKWRRKIESMRYYQEHRDEVLVQVVKGPAFVDGDLDVLRTELDRMLEGTLRCSFEFVDSLELTPSGKFRVVVSNVVPEN